MEYLRGLFGIVVLLGVALLFSGNRKRVDWKLVGIGVFIQLVFGVLITQVPIVAKGFNVVSEVFVRFLDFSIDGAKFVFGDLALVNKSGFIFAFQILPTIIFFSTVTAGLYYLGVLQKIVYGIAWVMAKTMRLSGAESLSAAGNIFLGQTEAPLLVKPFVAKMTKSELMCLMTGGMATLAGGVLAAYVSALGGDDPVEKTKFAAYLLSASIMNAPAAIVMSKILVPQTDDDDVDKNLNVGGDQLGVNLIDALSKGAGDGLQLALNVGGMLLAFIAVIAALNAGFGWIGGMTGMNEWVAESTGHTFDKLSMEYILGQIFRVFAWVIGVDWSESLLVGSLLGQKTAINEFVAYLNLAELKDAGALTPKAIIISTYALCGFANFSSIAIQIGGIGGIAPSKQGTLSQLGLRALLGATLACMMTATIAGMILV
ncbi:nucleoside transporter NupC [Fulvitalea axinellae]|uniref:Nucleoside transporter NupC n=1 Tax=Fulvitalea axinellae TaxID=1182444 RepID=A0AAU9CJN5_9BACT|nr:nucleoside transporter NupC [Fulvitalea axinellae]